MDLKTGKTHSVLCVRIRTITYFGFNALVTKSCFDGVTEAKCIGME